MKNRSINILTNILGTVVIIAGLVLMYFEKLGALDFSLVAFIGLFMIYVKNPKLIEKTFGLWKK